LNATEQLRVSVNDAAENDPGFQTYQQLTSLLELDLQVKLNHYRHLLSIAADKKKQYSQHQEVLTHRIADTESRLASVKQQITVLEQKELPQGHRDVCYWEEQLKIESTEIAASSSGGFRDGLLRQKRKVQY
jgi:hypothetical protein